MLRYIFWKDKISDHMVIFESKCQERREIKLMAVKSCGINFIKKRIKSEFSVEKELKRNALNGYYLDHF